MEKLYLMPVKKFGVAAMENWGLITGRNNSYCDIAHFFNVLAEFILL